MRVAGAGAGAKVVGFRGGRRSGLVGEPSLAVSVGRTGGSAKGFVGGRDPSQAWAWTRGTAAFSGGVGGWARCVAVAVGGRRGPGRRYWRGRRVLWWWFRGARGDESCADAGGRADVPASKQCCWLGYCSWARYQGRTGGCVNGRVMGWSWFSTGARRSISHAGYAWWAVTGQSGRGQW